MDELTESWINYLRNPSEHQEDILIQQWVESVGGPMRQNPIIVISGNTLSPNYVDIEIKRTV